MKKEEDVQMEGEEEQPSTAEPKPSDVQPMTPEVHPMDYKVSPMATSINPPHSGPYSTEENEPGSSSWKQTLDNIKRMKKRAQGKPICLCCGSNERSMEKCDNDNFAAAMGAIVAAFDHIEGILSRSSREIELNEKRKEQEPQKMMLMMTKMLRWEPMTCQKKHHV